jgi:hypothetical protein
LSFCYGSMSIYVNIPRFWYMVQSTNKLKSIIFTYRVLKIPQSTSYLLMRCQLFKNFRTITHLWINYDRMWFTKWYNYTKYDNFVSYGIWCHYGNFLDDTSHELVNEYYHGWWMSSSIGQNPTFSCQQLSDEILSWMIEI